MLKSILILLTAVFLSASILPAQGPKPQETAKSSPEVRARAKRVYTFDCAMCHGENGNGKTDMAHDMQLVIHDWTDPSVLANKQDKELFDIIRKGKDKMPAEEEGRAKNDEVWALIAYIRGFSKGQTAAQPAAPATPPTDSTPSPAN